MNAEIITGLELKKRIDSGRYGIFKYSKGEHTCFIKKRFLFFFHKRVKRTYQYESGLNPERIIDSDKYYAENCEFVDIGNGEKELKNPILINLNYYGFENKTAEEISEIMQMAKTYEIIDKEIKQVQETAL